jgi:hypothetical protein
MSRVPIETGCKKANFSGFTKFQNFFRKIRTYSTTLEFSPHSEKAFCHSVHSVPVEPVGVGNHPFCQTGIIEKLEAN